MKKQPVFNQFGNAVRVVFVFKDYVRVISRDNVMNYVMFNVRCPDLFLGFCGKVTMLNCSTCFKFKHKLNMCKITLLK